MPCSSPIRLWILSITVWLVELFVKNSGPYLRNIVLVCEKLRKSLVLPYHKVKSFHKMKVNFLQKLSLLGWGRIYSFLVVQGTNHIELNSIEVVQKHLQRMATLPEPLCVEDEMDNMEAIAILGTIENDDWWWNNFRCFYQINV